MMTLRSSSGLLDGDANFDADGSRVHVRSASRLGRSDFGVNRARIETIRARLVAAGG